MFQPIPFGSGILFFGLMVKSVSHDNGIVKFGERSPVGPPVSDFVTEQRLLFAVTCLVS